MFKKRWVRIVFSLLVLLLVGVIVAYQFLGFIIKTGITTVGPRLTGCPITLESLTLMPLRGKLELTNLVVGNPQGFRTDRSFALGKVRIALDPGSMFGGAIHISEITIEAPEITYEVGLGSTNLGKILANVEAVAGTSGGQPAPAAREQAPGKKVIIDIVSVTGARVRVASSLTGSGAAAIPLPSVQIRDIGKAKQGASMGEAVEKILSGVLTSVKGVVAQAGEVIGEAAKGATEAIGGAAKGAGDAVKGVGGAAKEGAASAVKGVKGLFGGDRK